MQVFAATLRSDAIHFAVPVPLVASQAPHKLFRHGQVQHLLSQLDPVLQTFEADEVGHVVHEDGTVCLPEVVVCQRALVALYSRSVGKNYLEKEKSRDITRSCSLPPSLLQSLSSPNCLLDGDIMPL